MIIRRGGRDGGEGNMEKSSLIGSVHAAGTCGNNMINLIDMYGTIKTETDCPWALTLRTQNH